MPRTLCIAFALMLAFGFATSVRAESSDYADAVLPAFASHYEQQFGSTLSHYDITARFDPTNNRLTVSESVDFVNFTGQQLDQIAFRLFPNADYYGSGYTKITTATIDGAMVVPSYSASNTSMAIDLAKPLAAGATTTIKLNFRVVVPDDSIGTFGVFSHNTQKDIWSLADWYPILAGWDQDRGWRLDAPTPAGDPTYADAASYDVTVTHPSDLKLIATGVSTDAATSGGSTTETFVTGPVRDFTIIASAHLAPVTATVGGTTLRVWSENTPDAQAAAAWVSKLAVTVLGEYGQEFGQYPYDELDIVATPLSASVLGISWSGMVMLSDRLLLDNMDWINANTGTAAFTLTHELGHQWWGNLVGANSNDHPFMVEGLTNASAMGPVDLNLGAAAAAELLQQQITGPYRDGLTASGDGVADFDAANPPTTGPSEAALVYGKGALGFLALREAMGDDAFYAALRSYASDFLFKNATTADLENEFVQHAPSGIDVKSLWNTWFEAATTTADDINQLEDALNATFYTDSGAGATPISSSVP